MSLPPVNLDAFYRSIDFNGSRYLYDIMCHAVICKYNFSIRETAKYLRLAKLAAYDVTHDNTKGHSFAFAEGKAIRFCLLYIVPILVGLKIVDSNRYEAFIRGKDSSPLLEFVGVRDHIFNQLLARDESYEACGDDYKVVTIEEKLEQVYDAIFNTNYDGPTYEKNVGEYEFNKQTREVLLRTISLFSKFTYID